MICGRNAVIALLFYLLYDGRFFYLNVRQWLNICIFLFRKFAHSNSGFRKCEKVFALDGYSLPYQSVLGKMLGESARDVAVTTVYGANRRKSFKWHIVLDFSLCEEV